MLLFINLNLSFSDFLKDTCKNTYTQQLNINKYTHIAIIFHLNLYKYTHIPVGHFQEGPGGPSGLGSWFKLACTDHCSLSLIRREFSPDFAPYKNGSSLTCIAREKVCQLPAQGKWFSLGTPASSTSKTDCRDMTEILFKMA